MLPLLVLLLAGAAEEPAKTEGFWPAPSSSTPTPTSTSTPTPTPTSTGTSPPSSPPAPTAAGLWPAPPPIPPPGPPGRPVTFLGGLVLGATDQVQPNVNLLLGGELGLLVDAGALRIGGMGSLGARRDAGAWSIGGLVGYGLRKPGRTNVDLLGELGLVGFWLGDSEELFSTRTISGGGAVLPYLGLRVIVGAGAEPGGAALSFFVQRTGGSTSSTYRVTDCAFLLPCETVTRVARYGGFAAGLAIDLAVVVRSSGRAGQAPPSPAEQGPAAQSW